MQGEGIKQGVRGLRVLNMRFQNAGGECLRLRYFAQKNEIAYSTFTTCGLLDFAFAEGGKNGEAIYIGTSSTQWDDGKNPTADPDASGDNLVITTSSTRKAMSVLKSKKVLDQSGRI